VPDQTQRILLQVLTLYFDSCPPSRTGSAAVAAARQPQALSGRWWLPQLQASAAGSAPPCCLCRRSRQASCMALLSRVPCPTIGSTAHLGDRLLAAAATHAHAVHHIALLGLVAQAARLVRAAWARQADQAGQLAVLPRANTQQEAQHITAEQQRDASA
jgi:hypothetical protein